MTFTLTTDHAHITANYLDVVFGKCALEQFKRLSVAAGALCHMSDSYAEDKYDPSASRSFAQNRRTSPFFDC